MGVRSATASATANFSLMLLKLKIKKVLFVDRHVKYKHINECLMTNRKVFNAILD